MVKSGYLPPDDDELPTEGPPTAINEQWRDAWEEYSTGPGSLDEEALPDSGDGEDDIAEIL